MGGRRCQTVTCDCRRGQCAEFLDETVRLIAAQLELRSHVVLAPEVLFRDDYCVASCLSCLLSRHAARAVLQSTSTTVGKGPRPNKQRPSQEKIVF